LSTHRTDTAPTRRRRPKDDPVARVLAPVQDPAWRAWLERILREGERASGGGGLSGVEHNTPAEEGGRR
jgi:hypothetical protein